MTRKSNQSITAEGSRNTVEESYHFCREIAKNSNFYNGIMLTKSNKRDAIFAIYAWLRAIDDITDNLSLTIAQKSAKLAEFKETTFTVLSDNNNLPGPFWLAFKTTIISYHIPYAYLENMIAAQQQDLVKYDYKTFAELNDYCVGVASMVGLILIEIWGYEGGETSVQLAEWCGIAFQLTNILRDINEDAKNNRVYLPAEYFNLNSLTAGMLPHIPKDKLLAGINTLIVKNDEYYKASLPLYQSIDSSGKLSFLVMFYAYRGLFEKIRKNPEITLTNTAIKLGKLEKIMMVMTAVINDRILHHA